MMISVASKIRWAPVSLLCLLWPSLLFAQKAGGSLASQEREITGGDLALISYVVLWVLVLAVVVVVFLRQKKLNQELSSLERKLDAHLGVSSEEHSS